MPERRLIVRKILTYLALTLGLSSIFWALIISGGSLHGPGGKYVVALMWMPGVAGMVTQLVFERNLRGMGWKLPSLPLAGWSYVLPLLYALIAYTCIWLAGWGGFPNPEFMNQLVGRYGGPPGRALATFFGLASSLGVLTSCLSAMGEEIGWRGLLVPQLSRITSFRNTALISGAAWSVWHYPVLIGADYNGGTPIWYGLTCFTVMVVGMSFMFAWMRLKSGSLWTGVLLHATHNLFIQGVFTPLTINTGNTRYFIDEFGAVLPVTAVVMALIFWGLRGYLPVRDTPEDVHYSQPAQASF